MRLVGISLGIFSVLLSDFDLQKRRRFAFSVSRLVDGREIERQEVYVRFPASQLAAQPQLPSPPSLPLLSLPVHICVRVRACAESGDARVSVVRNVCFRRTGGRWFRRRRLLSFSLLLGRCLSMSPSIGVVLERNRLRCCFSSNFSESRSPRGRHSRPTGRTRSFPGVFPWRVSFEERTSALLSASSAPLVPVFFHILQSILVVSMRSLRERGSESVEDV